jgi:hypothetical protein
MRVKENGLPSYMSFSISSLDEKHLGFILVDIVSEKPRSFVCEIRFLPDEPLQFELLSNKPLQSLMNHGTCTFHGRDGKYFGTNKSGLVVFTIDGERLTVDGINYKAVVVP